MFPIHHTIGRWMPSFPQGAGSRIFDHCASDDLLSLLPLSARFLARVDTIVLFFLSEKSKEYLS